MRRLTTMTGTPVPFDHLPDQFTAGVPIEVAVIITPAHPANHLRIERTCDGRRLPPVLAWPTGEAEPTGGQVFRAHLPALADNQLVEHAPVVLRAGVVVARLPGRLTRGIRDPALAPAAPATTSRDGVPRFAWESEFLGAFTVQLAKPPESFGATADGLHVTFYIASGEIRGPRLNARIRPEGGDWMLVRHDGVGVADVRITYETNDGALLLSRYYGIFDLGSDGYTRALRNEYDPLPPLVLAPQFVTSHPNWLWLTRLQCLAVGRVTMAELIVRFDLYAIRVGGPIPASQLPGTNGHPRIHSLT
jgi:hypothetical protein